MFQLNTKFECVGEVMHDKSAECQLTFGEAARCRHIISGRSWWMFYFFLNLILKYKPLSPLVTSQSQHNTKRRSLCKFIHHHLCSLFKRPMMRWQAWQRLSSPWPMSHAELHTLYTPSYITRPLDWYITSIMVYHRCSLASSHPEILVLCSSEIKLYHSDTSSEKLPCMKW